MGSPVSAQINKLLVMGVIRFDDTFFDLDPLFDNPRFDSGPFVEDPGEPDTKHEKRSQQHLDEPRREPDAGREPEDGAQGVS